MGNTGAPLSDGSLVSAHTSRDAEVMVISQHTGGLPAPGEQECLKDTGHWGQSALWIQRTVWETSDARTVCGLLGTQAT